MKCTKCVLGIGDTEHEMVPQEWLYGNVNKQLEYAGSASVIWNPNSEMPPRWKLQSTMYRTQVENYSPWNLVSCTDYYYLNYLLYNQ